MKKCFVFALTCLLTVFAYASPKNATKIVVGSSPVISSAGIFIAQEQGYFAERGLDVDIKIFRSSGAPMTVLLAKGQLDVGGGNLSAGLFNAINEGVDIKLVADKGQVTKDHSYIALLVRKDLVDSGKYKSEKDLKGYRMGLTTLEGVSQQVAAKKFLEKGGLTIDDVKFSKMPYSEMNLGLRNKTLDATIQLEPFIAKAEIDGFAKNMGGVYSVHPNQQSAAIFYSPQFIQKKSAAAYAFMEAYLLGVRDYELAMTQKKNWEKIVKILKKYTNVKEDNVYEAMIPVGLNPNGYLNVKELQSDLDWYKENKFVSKNPNLKTIVDHRFVDAALKKIGKYTGRQSFADNHH